MINSGTGRMTPIGTHQFDPYTLETTKTSLISNWSPLAITNGDTSELYRMHDGTLYWRSRLSEASLVDGNIVYPFLLYHPDTGWIREEPNLRAVYGSEISNSDNGRGEALDVTDDGTVVFIDMASSTVTFLSDIKAVWRRQGGVPLTLWHTQRFGTIYQALPPDGVAWIDCIDAGSGPALVSSYGVFTVRSGTFYANLFQSDRLIQDRDTHGLNGGFFYDPVAGSNDVTSYISTWRADGSTYRLRDNFVSPSSREIRLYVGDGNLTWTVVNTFADEEPFIRSMFSQFGLAPYRDGVFGRRTRSGLSGPGNQFNAVNYYGPATVAGEPISTIWHVRIGATAVTRQAVVSVVTPSGETGRINGHAMSDGKLYFSTGAGRAAYVNAHIDPGIYEVDPVTYGVRQVCGMPPGLAAGGWGSIWGDRRSAPA
jgi:hypothetical protein